MKIGMFVTVVIDFLMVAYVFVLSEIDGQIISIFKEPISKIDSLSLYMQNCFTDKFLGMNTDHISRIR